MAYGDAWRNLEAALTRCSGGGPLVIILHLAISQDIKLVALESVLAHIGALLRVLFILRSGLILAALFDELLLFIINALHTRPFH
jgi:hypothetical protein